MDTPTEHQTQNRRAVIDVGSNSVKILVADEHDGVISPILQRGKQTRLGKGVFESSILQTDRINETAHVISQFADQARELGATTLRILATSAAREATNRAEFDQAVAEAEGKLEIISGEEEANLILQGVRTHPDFANGPLAVIDVGGGSTELLIADENILLTQASHPLGTVRWLEKFPPNDPPTPDNRETVQKSIAQFIESAIEPQFKDIPLPPTLVASGGSPKFLTRLLKGTRNLSMEQIESTVVSLDEIRQLADQLWSLPLAERKKLPGISARRADVLLMGAAMYETMMEQFGFKSLRPSMRGLGYGAIIEK